jgi:hypothetical protein
MSLPLFPGLQKDMLSFKMTFLWVKSQEIVREVAFPHQGLPVKMLTMTGNSSKV